MAILKKIFWLVKDKTFMVMQKVLPYAVYRTIRICYSKLTLKDKSQLYREAYFASREKGKERYCIIRFNMPVYSLLAAGIQFSFMAREIKSKGFIPILDLEWEQDYQAKEIGKNNIWEICFEQPVDAKQAIKEKYVLVEKIGCIEELLDKNISRKLNGDCTDHFLHCLEKDWRNYYKMANEYFKETWVLKENFYDAYFKKYGIKIENKNVLGVAIREEWTQDVQGKIKNEAALKVFEDHPLMPDVDETIEIVSQCFQKWNCNYIFLSTRCETTIEKFVAKFGEKVFYINRKRMDIEQYVENYQRAFLSRDMSKPKSEGEYAETISTYMEEVLALSECDCFIGVKQSASAVALMLNGGKYREMLILPDQRNIERY